MKELLPLITLLLGVGCTSWLLAQVAAPERPSGTIGVTETLDSLLAEEDTDHDLRISVRDTVIRGTNRGDKRFNVRTLEGGRYEIDGAYLLSNLLEELTLAHDSGRATVDLARIFEPPADRVSRQIRELYWDGLTRRIDEAGLRRLLTDEKITGAGSASYLYVPGDDGAALAYYREIGARHPAWRLVVTPLTDVNRTGVADGKEGLLSLALRTPAGGAAEAVPFVVPGGRFNEMYGWDSYFIIRGLLLDGRVELARGIVDNFVYEIGHYGKVLNANRTYYLTRSQPPFLTSMALAVDGRLHGGPQAGEWLRKAFEAAIAEYRGVWTDASHLTPTGLSRYFDEGSGIPPEVEPGAFKAIFARYAAPLGIDAAQLEREYRAHTRSVPGLDSFFVHDRCMRESGHDTSYRLEGCCADLAAVDLNSLLYKMELDIAEYISAGFGGAVRLGEGRIERAVEWRARAARRKGLLTQYCWNARRGMYFDYNIAAGGMTDYIAATTFYPLWSGAADSAQAALVVRNALPLLEEPGGVAGSTEASRGPITPDHPLRQWDYPFGWAPHQIIVWDALRRYGYDGDARRLAYKWLYTIVRNAADYNGTITEKYDVVKRSHDVFAEYGNVGTAFSYITREGFGWTNASFQEGLSILTPALRDSLNKLTPPETIFR